jgi:hypothetical protein
MKHITFKTTKCNTSNCKDQFFKDLDIIENSTMSWQDKFITLKRIAEQSHRDNLVLISRINVKDEEDKISYDIVSNEEAQISNFENYILHNSDIKLKKKKIKRRRILTTN